MYLVPFESLACPIDNQPLQLLNNQLKCTNNHSFDIAKQRYVNLLPIQDKRSKSPGDSKEMVLARQRFLNTGVYQPIADKVNDIALRRFEQTKKPSLNVLDTGCGEGYYLQQLKCAAQQSSSENHLALLGMDISKPAILEATKRERQDISWVVATNRKLPVLTKSIDLLLCMFGFPVFDAFKESLSEQGTLLLVESGPSHLIELREMIYDEIKQSRLPSHEKAIELGFELAEEEHLCYQTEPLSSEQIQDLLIMTPHFFKAKPEKRELVSALPELTLTIDVHFRLFICNQ